MHQYDPGALYVMKCTCNCCITAVVFLPALECSEALEDVIRLGIPRVLTSGGRQSAPEVQAVLAVGALWRFEIAACCALLLVF
jgi:hypothetical protein